MEIFLTTGINPTFIEAVFEIIWDKLVSKLETFCNEYVDSSTSKNISSDGIFHIANALKSNSYNKNESNVNFNKKILLDIHMCERYLDNKLRKQIYVINKDFSFNLGILGYLFSTELLMSKTTPSSYTKEGFKKGLDLLISEVKKTNLKWS